MLRHDVLVVGAGGGGGLVYTSAAAGVRGRRGLREPCLLYQV